MRKPESKVGLQYLFRHCFVNFRTCAFPNERFAFRFRIAFPGTVNVSKSLRSSIIHYCENSSHLPRVSAKHSPQGAWRRCQDLGRALVQHSTNVATIFTCDTMLVVRVLRSLRRNVSVDNSLPSCHSCCRPCLQLRWTTPCVYVTLVS